MQKLSKGHLLMSKQKTFIMEGILDGQLQQ